MGTFHDIKRNICSPCPLGTFQSLEAQLSCHNCPPLTSTSFDERAASIAACKKLCMKGTYSRTGFEPCTRCPKGLYQAQLGGQNCHICPDNMTTQMSGATNPEQCLNKCQKGTISRSGLMLMSENSCAECPKNHFQDKEGQNKCIRCPIGTFTEQRGAPDFTNCIGEVTEISNHLIVIDFNDCMMNPCQNGATCHPLDDFGFYCQCQPGYSGIKITKQYVPAVPLLKTTE